MEKILVRKRISRLTLFLLVLAMMVMTVAPASAITDGEFDQADDYPYVVLLLMDVGGQPMFRCTATMIAPTFALTAGHCTNNFPAPDYTGMRIFTEVDVDAGTEAGSNDYPNAGSDNSIEVVRFAAHPDYEMAPFFFHDVGMIELAEPFYPGGFPGIFADVSPVDSLDALKMKGKKATFTSVGYGLQAAQLANPTPQSHTVGVRQRRVATTRLIQINVPGNVGDFAMLLTNNTKTGGTCFGDSGGPNFLGTSLEVAGITSFGTNPNCAGTGGVFRTDRQNVHDFVDGFMNP